MIPDPEIHALLDKYWAISHEPTLETQAFLRERGSMVWYDLGILSGYILKLEQRLKELEGIFQK